MKQLAARITYWCWRTLRLRWRIAAGPASQQVREPFRQAVTDAVDYLGVAIHHLEEAEQLADTRALRSRFRVERKTLQSVFDLLEQWAPIELPSSTGETVREAAEVEADYVAWARQRSPEDRAWATYLREHEQADDDR